MHQLSNGSLLKAHVLQPRGVGLGASMHHLSGNPLGEGDSQYNDAEGSLTSFDLASLTSEDDFTFVTHQVIGDYLKTHFCVSLH